MNFDKRSLSIAGLSVIPDNRRHIGAHPWIGEKVAVADKTLAALDRDKIGQIGEMRREPHNFGIGMRIETPEP